MKVKVIETGLKFKKFDQRGKRLPFYPKVGQIIDLPKEDALKEIEGENVRRLLPEEKQALEARIAKKKSKAA